jgi:hypothetical protein
VAPQSREFAPEIPQLGGDLGGVGYVWRAMVVGPVASLSSRARLMVFVWRRGDVVAPAMF